MAIKTVFTIYLDFMYSIMFYREIGQPEQGLPTSYLSMDMRMETMWKIKYRVRCRED